MITHDKIMKAYLAVEFVCQIHTNDIYHRLGDCTKPSSDIKLVQKESFAAGEKEIRCHSQRQSISIGVGHESN
jgi:hypothetical protein